MDFSVKDIQMGIKNVHNGNAVLGKSDISVMKLFFFYSIKYKDKYIVT